MPKNSKFPHSCFRFQRSLQHETLESRNLLSAVPLTGGSMPFSTENTWEIRAEFTPVECELIPSFPRTGHSVSEGVSDGMSASSAPGISGAIADLLFREEFFEGSNALPLESPEEALPGQLSVPEALQAGFSFDGIPGESILVSWQEVPNASRYRLTYTLTHPECEPIQLRKIFAADSLKRTETGRLSTELDAVIPGTTVEIQIQAVCGEKVFADSDLSQSVKLQTPDLSAEHSLTLKNGAMIPDVFSLHSRKASDGEAALTIYLDFTGHLTGETTWNTQTNKTLIVSPVFSLDEDPEFSTEELTMIYEIWQIIAEDYAGFAVDVTTEFPGLEHLKKTGMMDSQYGIRCVIGENTWYENVGGIAMRNSFTHTTDLPCFVFLAQNARVIGNAASHEIGHTLGLLHRGGGSAANGEYTYGVKIADENYIPTANSSVSSEGFVFFDSTSPIVSDWCPIMGASYYAGVSHWSDGKYFNALDSAASNSGDLEKIAAVLPFRNDDHADWIFTSGTTQTDPSDAEELLTFFGEPDLRFAPVGELLISRSGAIFTDGDFFHDSFLETVSGFISHRNDTDVFRFTLDEETLLDLTVSGAGEWANLDIWAGLYPENVLTAAGTASPILAEDPDSMDARISAVLQPGTYFLVIDGTGRTRTLENGQTVEYYSDYSSLGRYRISGSAKPVGQKTDDPQPDDSEMDDPEEEIVSQPAAKPEFHLVIRPASGSVDSAVPTAAIPSTGTFSKEVPSSSILPDTVNTVSSWTPLAVEIWMNGTEFSSEGQTETLLLNFDTGKYSWVPEAFSTANGFNFEITECADGLILRLTENPLAAGGQDPDPFQHLGTITLTPKFSAFSNSICEKLRFQLNGQTQELTVTAVCYDLNSDGSINIQDLVLLAKQYGQTAETDPGSTMNANQTGTAISRLSADFDCDGNVSIKDLVLMAKNFGLNFQQADRLYFASVYGSTTADKIRQ